MVGLFSAPQTVDDAPREALKQSLFQKLKAVTVPLLDASRSPVETNSTRVVLTHLRQLELILEATPGYAFSSALANYAFFPLTSLLQPHPDGSSRGDRVLEATMDALNVLVRRWRQAGMEDRVRKELWTMTILTLGGPFNQQASIKGKAVDRTEESKLAMIRVLENLMGTEADLERKEPAEIDDSCLPDNRAGTTESGEPVQAAPSLPIVFHTLTTLLALALDPNQLVQLQLASIAALRTLTVYYLASESVQTSGIPASLLATALPGMASTLSRLALSKSPASKFASDAPTRKQNSAVVVDALRLLALLIERSVSDIATTGLRREETSISTGSVSLEQLGEELPELDDQDKTDSSNPTTPVPASEMSQKGLVTPTGAWLRFTVSSLAALLAALSPLTSHHSPTVRSALVDLLTLIVNECPTNFGAQLEGTLEGLLILSGDEWEVVSAPARRVLLAVSNDQKISKVGGDIVQRRLLSLPVVLRKRNEVSIQRSTGVIRAALDMDLVDKARDFMTSSIWRWGMSLLTSFEMERIVTTSFSQGGGGMALAWIDEGKSTGEDPVPMFPPIRLRHIEDKTTLRSLDCLWGSFGSATARIDKEDSLIDYLVAIARDARRLGPISTNALWILDGLLRGLSEATLNRSRKKMLKNLVRTVISLMEDLESYDEENEAGENYDQNPRSQADRLDSSLDTRSQPTIVGDIPSILHSKGVTALPALTEYKPVTSLAHSSHDRQSDRILLLSFSLRVLASASSLLKNSFKPLLLPSLYHVLAFSSSTAHPLLRSHAQTTLSLLSSSTSFTSPQDLVLTNVDYIVNSVSQRMSVTRLDPSAPLVLVEMIRLVGKPIVTIVQDLVDDVFEALDDYHGYEEVTVGLWAVLDALLKVMEADLAATSSEGGSSPRQETRFDAFKLSFLHRKNLTGRDVPESQSAGGREDTNPRTPFSSTHSSSKAHEPDDPTEFPETEPQDPPTRPQVVTAQILSKSLYFLSHPSAFLRGRVLSLIACAVPLLARPSHDSRNRSADLLPVISRAWPFILNRLDDPELSVVVEAANLVEALASHVGEFLSRQILDDVWPRFRSLLAKQELNDSASALAHSTCFSNSHRLYRSILKTLLDVARYVPLKENVLWEQALQIRRFLSTSVHQELQDYALKIYRSFAELNRDVAWLLLTGMVKNEPGLPYFLTIEGLVFGRDVLDFLEQL